MGLSIGVRVTHGTHGLSIAVRVTTWDTWAIYRCSCDTWGHMGLSIAVRVTHGTHGPIYSVVSCDTWDIYTRVGT